MRFVHLMIIGLLLTSCDGVFHSDPWVKVSSVDFNEYGKTFSYDIFYDKTRIVHKDGKARVWVKSISTTKNGYDTRYYLEFDKFARAIETISEYNITPKHRVTELNKNAEINEKKAKEIAAKLMPKSMINQYGTKDIYDKAKKLCYYNALSKMSPTITFNEFIEPDSTEEKLYKVLFN